MFAEGIPEHYQQLLSISLAMIRPAAVFLIMPAFNPQTIPATVRNSIFISLSLVAFALHPPGSIPVQLPSLTFLAREIFIGISIGLFYSAFLYALEIAGQFIDMATGRSFASLLDPLGGHSSTLTGIFFSRFGQFIFMAGGGFMFMVGTLMESYALWPLSTSSIALDPQGILVFQRTFGTIMSQAILFAGPALCVLFVVDIALGMMNRFAQQLNVFALSLSIKAWLGIFVVLTMLGLTVSSIYDNIADQYTNTLPQLEMLIKTTH